MLHILKRIGNAGAGFRSAAENIDTPTPAGRMMMQMVGALPAVWRALAARRASIANLTASSASRALTGSPAEFERAMIGERTSAGLAAARAEWRIGGCRKKLDAGKRREIAESVISGRKTGAEIARLYKGSPDDLFKTPR